MPDPDIVQQIADFDSFCNVFDLTGGEAAVWARFDTLFMAYAQHTNVVARSTLTERWGRHYADSLQLTPLVSGADHLLDIGSGAGFPGLALATYFAGRDTGPEITLVDSVLKKTRFLREVISELALPRVSVVTTRAEVMADSVSHGFDVVTARAVASLDKLFTLSAPLLAPGGKMVFLKGERGEEELTDSRRKWTFDVRRHPSLTRNGAVIFEISDLRGVS